MFVANIVVGWLIFVWIVVGCICVTEIILTYIGFVVMHSDVTRFQNSLFLVGDFQIQRNDILDALNCPGR